MPTVNIFDLLPVLAAKQMFEICGIDESVMPKLYESYDNMGAPALHQSGKQEYLQSIVNEIMFK